MPWSKLVLNAIDALQHPTLRRVPARWHAWLDQLNTSQVRTELRRVAEKLERNLTVVDVGCRWGHASAWEVLGGRATVVGFDPDKEECDRIRAEYGGDCDFRLVPAALGAAPGSATLHLTEDPSCSSLLEPNPLHATFPELACLRPTGQAHVSVTTLDEGMRAAGIKHIDFLKIDTQGTELMVLQGATEALASARALEIEVEFNPLYDGQPLFSDVDRFLRERGFVLWRLKHLAHYSLRDSQRSPGGVIDKQLFDSEPVYLQGGGGQLFWCNAYFVRKDLVSLGGDSDWQTRLRDGCLFTLLGFQDLAGFAFEDAAQHGPPDLVQLLAPFRQLQTVAKERSRRRAWPTRFARA